MLSYLYYEKNREGNSLDSTDKFLYWKDIAEYDLETAEAMFRTGRWLYVVFMCQQSIEKLCKGIILLISKQQKNF
ncbi:MAG: HEPN domain-containing protein [Lachnoclostridium sp.]|jgi:HEPN domain-containing protein|nr:HEPN domain-containing protein [Lachnoclostridium sp.]